jgi:mRNA interferase HicA
MKYSELKKKLKESGCYLLEEGKRHEIWKSNVTGEEFPIGRHNTEEVPKGTLNTILKSAGLK